jgi:hypothetical protein
MKQKKAGIYFATKPGIFDTALLLNGYCRVCRWCTGTSRSPVLVNVEWILSYECKAAEIAY